MIIKQYFDETRQIFSIFEASNNGFSILSFLRPKLMKSALH